MPLALARQRLLTATFPWYELKDADRGPAAGFTYKRKQNRNGEEVGGIVPHVTLKSIANNEPPAEEVLVDRPEIVKAVTRVTGPFTVEATIPVAVGSEQWAVGSEEKKDKAEADTLSPDACWKFCASRRCYVWTATRRSLSRTSPPGEVAVAFRGSDHPERGG